MFKNITPDVIRGSDTHFLTFICNNFTPDVIRGSDTQYLTFLIMLHLMSLGVVLIIK